jgi:hypothetical protein
VNKVGTAAALKQELFAKGVQATPTRRERDLERGAGPARQGYRQSLLFRGRLDAGQLGRLSEVLGEASRAGTLIDDVDGLRHGVE